ncbi:hypothetical protein ACFCZ1_05870 [Streptomyces sp. NPDC056224]|uniref:hypothetical protein n=1 Tax=Streptomyces sp. NPDC056224 TaxID=3345750 RepID=UPI0035E16EE7
MAPQRARHAPTRIGSRRSSKTRGSAPDPVPTGNHARAVARARKTRAVARAVILFGCPEARRNPVHPFIDNVVDAAFGTGGTVRRARARPPAT